MSLRTLSHIVDRLINSRFLAVGVSLPALGVFVFVWHYANLTLRSRHLTLIGADGSHLSRIYEGVAPSAYWLTHRSGLPLTQKGTCPAQLAAAHLTPISYAAIRLVQSCSPDDTCAGHYEAFSESFGCTDPSGNPCSEQNFSYSPAALYSDGEYNHYDSSCSCCVTAIKCDNE
jgi:hypothetical protein